MRIAIDVKGTLEGPKKRQLLALIHGLQSKGHTVVIWSNLYQYASDAVENNNLNCNPMSKMTLMDAKNNHVSPMDLAIDDDSSQDWLASKRFIWVHQLPEALEDVTTLVNNIDKEKWSDTKCQDSRWLSRVL